MLIRSKENELMKSLLVVIGINETITRAYGSKKGYDKWSFIAMKFAM